MRTFLWTARRGRRLGAFTLVEVLVAMTVLLLLVGLIAQMTGGVASIINRGQSHIETDGYARALMDRMAIDIGAMVKRSDVDYYLKGRPATLDQRGNDQIAFYSEVPGYFSSKAGAREQSSASVVAYRVNGDTLRLERLCKGLAWNGSSVDAGNPMAFLPVPLAAPLASPFPSPMPDPAPTPMYPQAADPLAADLDYEALAPQVFRFEYYYVLKGQGATNAAPALSLSPWYVAAPVNHTAVEGMRDVAGIGVLIAVIDQKNRTLLSKIQLATLAAQMEDAPDPPLRAAAATDPRSYPGELEQKWMTTLNSSTLPRPAISSIRIYSRCFYLNGVSP